MATLRETYRAVFGEKIRAGGKMYCRRCGLVALNNEFSQWSVRMGCLSELHPSYKRMRKG